MNDTDVEMQEQETFTDSPPTNTTPKRRSLRTLYYDCIVCFIQNPTIGLIILVILLICLDIILKTDITSENYSTYINKTKTIILDILDGGREASLLSPIEPVPAE